MKHFSGSVHLLNDLLDNSDSSVSSGARDELRLRVLRALEANPELSQRQLAAELGVSLGGVNYALKALVEPRLCEGRQFSEVGQQGGLLVRLNPARGR
jgi:predicted transcriptional regulator